MVEPRLRISIHAPREGCDKQSRRKARTLAHYFNPRPPRGGATRRLDTKLRLHRDFNPRPREGGDVRTYEGSTSNCISIHAPREGGDVTPTCWITGTSDFNPRPPRGGRPLVSMVPPSKLVFQSTPPARGATAGHYLTVPAQVISIHAPREGGDMGASRSARALKNFNPRPPRGGRQDCLVPCPCPAYFNPRPPRGGRLIFASHLCMGHFISIHAPREGGDGVDLPNAVLLRYFNPRPPRGGRLVAAMRDDTRVIFQSTPPARGGDAPSHSVAIIVRISIHAPREGGDGYKSCWSNGLCISIHAPREGGDLRGSAL